MRMLPRMGIGLVALLLLPGCDEPDPTTLTRADILMARHDAADAATHAETLPTSLHATAAGMRYWYERDDGIGPLIGAPYEARSCAGCHVAPDAPEGCAGCHDHPEQGRGTVRAETCLACHARQAAEISLGLPDVHRTAGLECWDCHTDAEIHGDGVTDRSMFEAGVMETRCTDCHGAPSTAAHLHHGDRLACPACHMATSVTCVNCHFEKEVEEGIRVAAGKVAGWQFLGNYRGQVYPLNFQSLEIRGHSFVAWGPYAGHAIVAEGRPCGDCHASPAVLALMEPGGQLQVLRWDPDAARFDGARGVIPVPADFRQTLRFDFVALQDDGSRTFVEAGPDAAHMLFATPLTTLQMASLATPQEPHAAPLAGPPLCGGRAATIWVGMDPALLPGGASITALAGGHDDGGHDDGAHDDGGHDSSHDDGHGTGSEGTGGHDEGGEPHPFRYVIVGTREADVIVGSSAPDSIVGLRGDDVICGLQARDVIEGGMGDDRIYAGPGADLVTGDAGDDFLEGGPGWDVIRGGAGDDWIFGQEGQDQLLGESGDDYLFGGKSPDVLDGGPGINHLDYGPEICEGTGPGAGPED